jgi:hypothetical protein
MTAGNPFVLRPPAGAGTSGWVEGFVHAGVYGLLPLAGTLHAHGGASAIARGSTGQELFTELTRSHVAWNRLRAEAFDLDPDELPAIDTRTRLQGVNVELLDAQG